MRYHKPLKSLLIVYLIVGVLPHFATARVGGGDAGGGDAACENRIKILREDIKVWISKGGPKNGLQLPSRISVEQYSQSMLHQIEKAQFECVGPGDKGYPVEMEGVPKVCRFDKGKDFSFFRCDFLKFNASSEADQYINIHHEYAGLAEIEVPNGADSNYDVSNQLSVYLEDQVVKRLAIKPTGSPGNGFNIKISDIKPGNYGIPSLDRLQWDPDVCGIYVEPYPASNEISMTYVANPTFPHECQRNGESVRLKCSSEYAKDCTGGIREMVGTKRPFENEVEYVVVNYSFSGVPGHAFSLSKTITDLKQKNLRYLFHNSEAPQQPKYFSTWALHYDSSKAQATNCREAKEEAKSSFLDPELRCLSYFHSCKVYKEHWYRPKNSVDCGYAVMYQGQ